MNYKDYFNEIEHDEALAQSCPICETPLHRVVAPDPLNGKPKTWIACECMTEEDFFGKAVMVSEQGFHDSIREIWGEEVLYMMRTRPELFPPGTIPGPIDDI